MAVVKVDRSNYYVQIRYTLNGVKKTHKKTGFRTKADAREYELAYNRKLRNQVDEKITVGELWSLLYEHKKSQVKEDTLDAYDSIYNMYIKPYYHNTPMNRINHITIEQWKSKLIEYNLSDSRYKKINLIMAMLFNYGNENGLFSLNYYGKAIKNPNKLKAEMRVWELAKFKKFIEVVPEDQATLFHTLYYTGMRFGELQGLQWSDINFELNTIKSASHTTTRNMN